MPLRDQAIKTAKLNRRSEQQTSQASEKPLSTDSLPANISEPEGFGVLKEGDGNTLDFKMYITKAGKKISPFHGIPAINPDGSYNMVVEIPQGTKRKIEINKEEELNPLTYDKAKKDPTQIREVVYQAKGTQRFGYPFHYGAIPQTWEHAGQRDPHTKQYGDNDPIDVFDISSLGKVSGDIKRVKVLGAFAMLDAGETDWKVIAIDVNDENAEKYNDLSDVPDSILKTVEDFLTNYKTRDQSNPSVEDLSKQNKFADPKTYNAEKTKAIIKETGEAWKKLTTNTALVVQESKERIDNDKDFTEKTITDIKLTVQ